VADAAYEVRKGELKTYFNATARSQWIALTSNSPVSRIRETVRAGRADMRNTLLSWLPEDLSGARMLDAGCGTGMLAIELARRGADVVAVDIAPGLIEEAKARLSKETVEPAGRVSFLAGDMADPAHGSFDYLVAMDSLIHYRMEETVATLSRFAPRIGEKMIFTFAPRTPALAAMHAAGKLFPRGDRSPAIVPLSQKHLGDALVRKQIISADFCPARTLRISTAFYKSQAMELVKP